MVFWKTAAINVLEDFVRRGAVWVEPSDVPGDVHGAIDALCFDATGRSLTNEELAERLAAAT